MADDRDHVVIEMAELTQSGDPDATTKSTKKKRPKVPWTTSTVLSREERDEEFDQDMLYRAIADTGRWAYGTISVEAWILDEHTGKLVRPKRAFWFDPVAVMDGKDNESLQRLVDYKREDFVRPDPLAPGVGLAGALWAELSHPGINYRLSMPSFADAVIPKRVAWREVASISNDPDQPYNLRLKLAVEAGIGLAAGVKYQFRGTQGLVMYMARSTTDITKLKSPTNEEYLLSAADVIGSIVCLRGPRKTCLAERRDARESVRRRLRQKMVAFIRMGGTLKGVSDTPELPDKTTGREESVGTSSTGELRQRRGSPIGKFKSKLMLIATKWRGAMNEPPPPFTTTESLWSFLGCFMTLLMLLNFSDAISKRNPEYSLVTGPFGALMTLQYSLTAAPASQPRNVILGQAISISIALGMTYTSLAINLRKALGTALAIMCMARLGVTHPPAGAAALIFSGGGYSWGHMGILLTGNILAIFFATIINDMNVKRQYPTFWGFGYWRKHYTGGCARKDGSKSE